MPSTVNDLSIYINEAGKMSFYFLTFQLYSWKRCIFEFLVPQIRISSLANQRVVGNTSGAATEGEHYRVDSLFQR